MRPEFYGVNLELMELTVEVHVEHEDKQKYFIKKIHDTVDEAITDAKELTVDT